MSFWVVYTEGLRSITRSKMSTIAMAILLLGVGLFAAFVGAFLDGQGAFLVLTYLVVPSGIAALAAIQIATPRTTKFVQAVFTAPVSRIAYFCSHVAVAVTVGLLYLAFTLPFLLLHVAHDALPPAYWTYVLAGLLLTVYGAAFGTLAGVVSTGRSIIPAALVGAMPILLLLCVPMVFAAVWSGADDPITGVRTLTRKSRILLHLAHLSPHVNIMDGLGLWSAEVIPKHPIRSVLWLVGSAVGMVATAAWVFLRLQGVEDWESGGRKQAVAALLVLAVLAAPALQPDADAYGNPDDAFDSYPTFLRSGEETQVYVVARGAPADLGTFYSSLWERPLRIGTTNPVDLVIMFPSWTGMNVTAVNLTFEGEGHARLVGLERFARDPWTASEHVTRFGFGAPVPVLRVPTSILIEGSQALANARFSINVTGDFRLSGGPERTDQNETSEGTTTNIVVESHAEFIASVPGAQTQAAAIMAPVPLAFLAGGIVRWARRR